jgi:hypothetical protein
LRITSDGFSGTGVGSEGGVAGALQAKRKGSKQERKVDFIGDTFGNGYD